jgi:hypothetical protein
LGCRHERQTATKPFLVYPGVAPHVIRGKTEEGFRTDGILETAFSSWAAQALSGLDRGRTAQTVSRAAFEMSQQELLATVIHTLEELGIEYMITGSIASSLQGEPRSTHDIDIVVNLPGSKAHALAAAFPPPDFYIDREAVLEAVATNGMVNLIDTRSGDEVDFWLLTESPFDVARFGRRCFEELLGMHMAVSSPEDTILMKLHWSKISGGSNKQFIDAVRVYEVQYETLDQEYLREWTLRLGLENEMERLRNEAKID